MFSKLVVGEPNDVYMQECERVGEAVMRMPGAGSEEEAVACGRGGAGRLVLSQIT